MNWREPFRTEGTTTPDFTTFRLQFTEPVDPQSVVYGQTIRLADQAGEPVNAEVYVKDHRVTVDPEGYLDPARTYNLTVTSGIKSALLGDTLSEDRTLTFNPTDSRSPTGKRQIMAQVAENMPGQLPLTGADYNSVNLSSRNWVLFPSLRRPLRAFR